MIKDNDKTCVAYGIKGAKHLLKFEIGLIPIAIANS